VARFEMTENCWEIRRNAWRCLLSMIIGTSGYNRRTGDQHKVEGLQDTQTAEIMQQNAVLTCLSPTGLQVQQRTCANNQGHSCTHRACTCTTNMQCSCC
jgi:hypothetical protein